MDCGYHVSLLLGMALAFVGAAAGFTGIEVVLDGDPFGISGIATGIVCICVAVPYGQQAYRRRQSRE